MLPLYTLSGCWTWTVSPRRSSGDAPKESHRLIIIFFSFPLQKFCILHRSTTYTTITSHQIHDKTITSPHVTSHKRLSHNFTSHTRQSHHSTSSPLFKCSSEYCWAMQIMSCTKCYLYFSTTVHNYNLLKRPHNYQLPVKIISLQQSNFIIRVLFTGHIN